MATKDLDTLDLPKNPSTSEATLGKDHLLYVDNSTTATPVWNLVGGQRGADLTQDADSIDTSHKTSGGWKSAAAGMRSWKLEYSGLAVMGDDGLTILEACYRQGKAAHIKLEYPDGSYRTGWAAVTSFSLSAPHDGAATLKSTLSGQGAISQVVTPTKATMDKTTGTFSKAAAADLTFTISPNTETLRSVMNSADEVLTKGTDYTYTSGTFVIKKEYLANLTNGTATVNVNASTAAFALTITVTD